MISNLLLTFVVVTLSISDIRAEVVCDENGAPYANTSATPIPCKGNEDCYKTREPSEWCRLQENQKWLTGCFCDSLLKNCVIERSTGQEDAFTYCIPEEAWKCESPEL